MITEEQYNKLQEFDRQLMTTKRAGYVRIAPADFKKVLKIFYGDDWEKKVPKNVFSCSYCKLQQMSDIAIEYYKYEKEHSNE